MIPYMKALSVVCGLLSLTLALSMALAAQPVDAHARAGHVVSPDGTFLFKYSGSLVWCEKDKDDRWAPSESCGAYMPICADFSSDSAATVACVAYPAGEMKGTNFSAAALAVNELKKIATESECLKLKDAPPQVGKTQQETLSGVEFRVTKLESGAAGHMLNSLVYRGFNNGTCYELDINIASTNIANYDPGTVKAFDAEKVERSLKAVLASFKFLK